MIRMLVAGLATMTFTASTAGDIASVLAHPPFDAYYVCGEHRQGELPYLGDDLGTDCVVQELVTENGHAWARSHVGDGTKNEDWYGWNKPLLAPCDCEISEIHLNPVVNVPGKLGKPPASMITFKRDDGVHFVMAHVQALTVEVGDRVRAGQPVARVGNNGYGRIPHVHMGAWKEKTALQIRWDTSIPSAASAASE